MASNTMKLYIIIAHKEPKQLKRLVERLNDSNSTFFIHVDLKVDIIPFKQIIDHSNVYFIDERVNCIWGDYSIVIATLNLLKLAIETQNEGHIILLSGQDYPIKSNEYIDNYLRERFDFEFINYVLNPIDKSSNLYKQRVEKYKFNLSDDKGDYILLPSLFRLSKKDLKIITREIIKGRLNAFELLAICTLRRKSKFKHHYKGTQWWCFSYNTAKKIYNYYVNNKRYLDNYYKHTLCADEHFFHTILKEVSRKHCNIKELPNLHFIDWSRKNGPIPAILKKEDLNLLLQQDKNKLFARKFDYQVDVEILDLIDDNLQCKF